MKYFFLTLFVIFGFSFASHANASVLKIHPSEQIVQPGDIVIVDVQLDSEAQTINAVEGYITYSPEILQPVELSRGGSFLTLWPEEPQQNAIGSLQFSGGIPGGTIAWNGLVLRLSFEVLAPGTAEIAFVDARSGAYLNDGLGTATQLTTQRGVVFVESLAEDALHITSGTHPDQTAWYQEDAVELQFPLRENADYAYTLSIDPLAHPADIPQETTGTVRYGSLDDGIWYFALQERRDGEEWGAVNHFRIKIDSTPPEPFEPVFTLEQEGNKGTPILLFSAHDALSGVERYTVQEGTHTTEDAASPYVIRDPDALDDVVIRAYDYAGNVRKVTYHGRTGTVVAENNNQILLLSIIAGLLVLSLFLFMVAKRND
ncbi:MAG: cohesin domain-containing protein [Patescibacteria group bacterium]|jgi:hypothetical protein